MASMSRVQHCLVSDESQLHLLQKGPAAARVEPGDVGYALREQS